MPIFDPAGYLVVLLMRVYTGGALVQVHELALGYVYELGLVLWHERHRALVQVHGLALEYAYELGLVLWHERHPPWALGHTNTARDQRFGSS